MVGWNWLPQEQQRKWRYLVHQVSRTGCPLLQLHAAQVLKQVKERLPNCRNRSQAEGVLMARKAAIFEGTYQRKRKVEPTTIKTFAKRFLETKRHLKTLKKYRQQLDQYIIPFFGSQSLEHITGSECLEFYNKRLDSGSAISTVNGEVACLKSLFSEAIRSGLVQINPVKGIKLMNPNNARDRILSDEETARLFWAAVSNAGLCSPPLPCSVQHRHALGRSTCAGMVRHRIRSSAHHHPALQVRRRPPHPASSVVGRRTHSVETTSPRQPMGISRTGWH